MSDVTIKRLDEMESVHGGVFVRARASLGVTSFGMQVQNFPPNYPDYPEHDEIESGQEEVYIALQGSARLLVGGKEYRLEPGVFARVGPKERRKIVPGPEGVRMLSLGGEPGRAYRAPAWSELGAS